MTPVTRKNISVDELTIGMIDILEIVTGASQSEIIRRGVGAYWLEMEPIIDKFLDDTQKKRARAIREKLAAKR
jgi:hypothetical protein